ncbi:MAG: nucleotidyltransferase family protein [Halobacteriota archaeon]|nr:nucleotidyltransferase family protein [Halobacteriota archaeon]MDY6959426.1 nucleotidyltransferase family protein [Halobacteriota archaeon]
MDDTTLKIVKGALKFDLNWEYVVRNGAEHGILPLLHHNLSKLDEGLVPENIMVYLRKQYNVNVAKNLTYYEELGKVLRVFREEGIGTIILKGAALAETVYGDIGLRPFSDVDLLIKKENLSEAKKILSEMGYMLDEEVSPEKYNEEYGCDLYYAGKKNIIEIHWNILRKLGSDRFMRIDIRDIWERARPASISGVDTLVMSPEDQLLHLCIHLPKHRYNRLIWLCDILEVVKHYNIDWDQIIRSSEDCRTKAHIYYGLQFSDEMLGPEVPPEVLRRLRPNPLERMLVRPVLKDVLSDDRRIMPIFNLMKLFLIDKHTDRIRYLWIYIFPPVESLERKYSVSGSRVYFYYILHPFYVIFTTARRFLAIFGFSKKKS